MIPLSLLLTLTGPAAAAELPLPDRHGPTQAITLGLGGSVGGGLYRGEYVLEGEDAPRLHGYGAGSPVVSLDWELGGERARLALGVESQPTYLYWLGNDVLAIDLVHLRVGGMFGGDALRAGPEVSAGVLSLGGGARLVYAPWLDRRGRRHGLDVRAEYLAGGEIGGRLTVLWAYAPWVRFGGATP